MLDVTEHMPWQHAADDSAGSPLCGTKMSPVPLEMAEDDGRAALGDDGWLPPVPEELLVLKGGGTAAESEELTTRECGSVTLTWFYDEKVLEQLSKSQQPLRGLSFEIRQRSESNGRWRTRIHSCSCRLPSNGDEIEEQRCIVCGCTPGRTYLLSVRAIAEVDGQGAIPSPWSETVRASIPANQSAKALSRGSRMETVYECPESACEDASTAVKEIDTAADTAANQDQIVSPRFLEEERQLQESLDYARHHLEALELEAQQRGAFDEIVVTDECVQMCSLLVVQRDLDDSWQYSKSIAAAASHGSESVTDGQAHVCREPEEQHALGVEELPLLRFKKTTHAYGGCLEATEQDNAADTASRKKADDGELVNETSLVEQTRDAVAAAVAACTLAVDILDGSAKTYADGAAEVASEIISKLETRQHRTSDRKSCLGLSEEPIGKITGDVESACQPLAQTRNAASAAFAPLSKSTEGDAVHATEGSPAAISDELSQVDEKSNYSNTSTSVTSCATAAGDSYKPADKHQEPVHNGFALSVVSTPRPCIDSGACAALCSASDRSRQEHVVRGASNYLDMPNREPSSSLEGAATIGQSSEKSNASNISTNPPSCAPSTVASRQTSKASGSVLRDWHPMQNLATPRGSVRLPQVIDRPSVVYTSLAVVSDSALANTAVVSGSAAAIAPVACLSNVAPTTPLKSTKANPATPTRLVQPTSIGVTSQSLTQGYIQSGAAPSSSVLTAVSSSQIRRSIDSKTKAMQLPNKPPSTNMALPLSSVASCHQLYASTLHAGGSVTLRPAPPKSASITTLMPGGSMTLRPAPSLS